MIAHSAPSIIVREYYEAMKNHIRPLFKKNSVLAYIQNFGFDLEDLYDIPYVLGTIHRSHISIIPPFWDLASYYCRKRFYLALIQVVLDAQCKFWDYNFG